MAASSTAESSTSSLAASRLAINLFTEFRLPVAVKFGRFQPNFLEPNNYPFPPLPPLLSFSIQLAINPLAGGISLGLAQPPPTNQVWPSIIRNAPPRFMRPITPSRTYQKPTCEKNGPFPRPPHSSGRARQLRAQSYDFSVWFIDPTVSQSAR